MKKLFKRSFVDEQIDLTESYIRKCKFGTPEYGRYLDVRCKLIEQKKKEKRQIPWKDIADISLRVVEIGGNLALVIGGYVLYANIAKMSYGLDTDMVLCNGRVNNMKDQMLKLIPKKV